MNLPIMQELLDRQKVHRNPETSDTYSAEKAC